MGCLTSTASRLGKKTIESKSRHPQNELYGGHSAVWTGKKQVENEWLLQDVFLRRLRF